MTLRNAFGELALDETLQALLAAIEVLNETMVHQSSMLPSRALQYARTATDTMRVNIDSGFVDRIGGIDMWTSGTYVGWYGRGAPNSVDQRELQKDTSIQTFNSVRNNRWVIT